jgi:hypothetical protein
VRLEPATEGRPSAVGNVACRAAVNLPPASQIKGLCRWVWPPFPRVGWFAAGSLRDHAETPRRAIIERDPFGFGLIHLMQTDQDLRCLTAGRFGMPGPGRDVVAAQGHDTPFIRPRGGISFSAGARLGRHEIVALLGAGGRGVSFVLGLQGSANVTLRRTDGEA